MKSTCDGYWILNEGYNTCKHVVFKTSPVVVVFVSVPVGLGVVIVGVRFVLCLCVVDFEF